jgi:hypothetical protein
MAFQGSLRELPLPDIIELVAVSGESGVFSVEDGLTVGNIFLDQGQIVHAEVGGIRGEEAVYEISIWPDGDFQFEPDDSALPSPTIDKPNTNLLLEAARRMDEWTILSKRIRSTRMIPVFAGTDQGGVSFNPGEWDVIKKIDQRRSLEGIALAIDQSPFEVAKIAFGLIGTRIIELREHAPFLEPERLAKLTPEALEELTSGLHQEVASDLTNDHSLQRLERLFSATRDLEGHEQRVDALIGLVRSSQHLISADFGPSRASNFYHRVEELIGEL